MSTKVLHHMRLVTTFLTQLDDLVTAVVIRAKYPSEERGHEEVAKRKKVLQKTLTELLCPFETD